MDTNEIALQLTLKAMETKRIPHKSLPESPSEDDIAKIIKTNSQLIADFFLSVRDNL